LGTEEEAVSATVAHDDGPVFIRSDEVAHVSPTLSIFQFSGNADQLRAAVELDTCGLLSPLVKELESASENACGDPDWAVSFRGREVRVDWKAWEHIYPSMSHAEQFADSLRSCGGSYFSQHTCGFKNDKILSVWSAWCGRAHGVLDAAQTYSSSNYSWAHAHAVSLLRCFDVSTGNQILSQADRFCSLFLKSARGGNSLAEDLADPQHRESALTGSEQLFVTVNVMLQAYGEGALTRLTASSGKGYIYPAVRKLFLQTQSLSAADGPLGSVIQALAIAYERADISSSLNARPTPARPKVALSKI
jgi:hypothetical protein